MKSKDEWKELAKLYSNILYGKKHPSMVNIFKYAIEKGDGTIGFLPVIYADTDSIHIRNEVKNMVQTERRGIYKGKEYIFTHVNMRVREVYSPDILSTIDGQAGTWVNMDNVKWLDENNKIVEWR